MTFITGLLIGFLLNNLFVVIYMTLAVKEERIARRYRTPENVECFCADIGESCDECTPENVECLCKGFHTPFNGQCPLNTTPENVERHNHMTRDIKPLGQCPACDRYHNRTPKNVEGPATITVESDGHTQTFTVPRSPLVAPSSESAYTDIELKEKNDGIN